MITHITCHFVYRWLSRVDGRESELKKLAALNPHMTECQLVRFVTKDYDAFCTELKQNLKDMLTSGQKRLEFERLGVKLVVNDGIAITLKYKRRDVRVLPKNKGEWHYV